MPAEGNVGLAFGLVFAAGLSTTIGASVVFCANLAQPKLLAVSLGFAAGVMLYVSFAEIFLRKSVAAFEAIDLDTNEAYRYSTLCFFGGMVVIAVLDKIVHLIADCAGRRSRRAARGSTSTANLLDHVELASERTASAAALPTQAPRQQQVESSTGRSPRGCPAPQVELGRSSEGGTCVINPLAGRTPDAYNSSQDEEDPERAGSDAGQADERPALVGDVDAPQDALQMAAVQEQAAQNGSSSRQPPAVVEIMKHDHHNWALQKMGVLTGLAIFIHNFPEGLATFVGALADAKVGVGIAIAIAMHNIPEGICVAMPIYYATGSKTKGFVWAFLSGVSEPIGGLLGYFALSGNNGLAFAIVFALVAGMMVYISIKELIPTALKYDPDDKVVTSAVIFGMVVMAGSLLLFTL